MKKIVVLLLLLPMLHDAWAQKILSRFVPETGQVTSYTATPGEDADHCIHPLSFTDNGDGTITDHTNLLMWQKISVGDMTIEQAQQYVKQLSLGGYSDWRLPKGNELLGINHFDRINPAIDTSLFTLTIAEYWWTSERRADDTTRIWAVNAGGGIGPHPKIEAIGAGGTKHFYVRAVRDLVSTSFTVPHFTSLGNGIVKDNFTGLQWQQVPSATQMNWEAALAYSNACSLGGYRDWRLPNIKELQSLSMPALVNPAVDKNIFTTMTSGDFWSSTSLFNTPAKAWDMNTQYGIVTQHDKTLAEHVILVRGGKDAASLLFSEAAIPSGEFDMGDHFGFVDPGHPSDETPIHAVKVDSFTMARTETSHLQFLQFLNDEWIEGRIEVRNNTVYRKGDTNVYCFTNAYAPYYSIAFNGKYFSMANYRATHPMSGINWYGCIAFCNWLSRINGLDTCYSLQTGQCDFTRNGYRLPTEAEWEWAARGGHTNPYFNYCKGNTLDTLAANLPTSGDPYEAGTYPQTTPCGFYDGTVHAKTDYAWPSNRASYATHSGMNDFGLYDMQGNVWELLQDWYGQDYYSKSDYYNPKGPLTGFIMPDGKPYRGMRGGNWYNGLMVNGISDGHSRVSNRNPSYYRGPQDPNHPWYHIGFRVVRKTSITTGIENFFPGESKLLHVFPNPASETLTVMFSRTEKSLHDAALISLTGQVLPLELTANANAAFTANIHDIPEGIYLLRVFDSNEMPLYRRLLIQH